MRIRLLSLVAPVLLAGTMLLVVPAAARAADGMTETGTTTYEVNPGKSEIEVTIKISVHNQKPDTVSGDIDTSYYWDKTEIAVEQEAGPVSATSNAGRVTQSTKSSDDYYRYIDLTYPDVFYGQTRVVTATYAIPAAPHAKGGFRAGLAYASLCAVGNGLDTGTVSVVLPSGYDLYVDGGGDLKSTGTSGGKQVFSSGTQASPYKFWTCVDAEDPAKLTHTALTTADQAFDIEAWPEDSSWSADVSGDINGDVPRLEDLTGLSMPGGTVKIVEAGDLELGEYGGSYNSATTTADIPETVQKEVVAHELSHIWFNKNLFEDRWVSEGLAGYSQQAAGAGNYTPCSEPGAYPGTGSPDLMNWQLLTNNSTTQQENVSDWQYAASCYVFTTLAGVMGQDQFKTVLEAASAREMAYIGATPGEKTAGGNLPLSSEQMLDLIDELGMVPAGITDLDTAQDLLAKYGIFDSTALAARSTARAAYHALETSAGNWKMPFAVRNPMSNWQFDSAESAITTAKQILDARDSIQKTLPGFSLDGTLLQKEFEGAASQADLASALADIEKLADAAATVDQATKARSGGQSILQAIGLLGTDLSAPLAQARTDLQNDKPDTASAEAQSVIDRVNAATDQGLLRGGAVVGTLALLLLLLALILFVRRRRPAMAVAAPQGVWPGPQGTWPGPVSTPPPGGMDPSTGPTWWQAPPQGPGTPWQTPPQGPGAAWQTPPQAPGGPWQTPPQQPLPNPEAPGPNEEPPAG